MKKQALKSEDIYLLSQYGLDNIDLRNALRLSFEKDEHLFPEGEPIAYIYFIVSGKAKVFLNLSNGKRLLLCYFISKGIIGEIELMTGVHTPFVTIQAVSGFTCVGLPLAYYGEILKTNIIFMNYIGKELAKKLTQRGMNDAITVLQPAEARLCAYIIQTETNGIFLETLTEAANLLGTSYRHLLRCLDKLCRDEVLYKEGRGYRIVNRQLLSEKAGDLYDLK